MDGLPRGLCDDRLGVDVLELPIAVGMLRALVGLAVRLPAVAERRQQSLHAAGADLVALLLQRVRHLVVAFSTPTTAGPYRVAERGRLDDAAQVPQSASRPRLDRCRRPTALAALPAFRQAGAASRSFSPRPMVDPRQPRDCGDCPQTAPSLPPRTSPAANTRRPRSSSFEPTKLPSLPNRLRVDHADPHTAAAPSQESRRPESNHHMAHRRYPIHLL